MHKNISKFNAQTKLTFFKSFMLWGVMSPRSMRDEALLSVLDESDGIVLVDVRRDAGNTSNFGEHERGEAERKQQQCLIGRPAIQHQLVSLLAPIDVYQLLG